MLKCLLWPRLITINVFGDTYCTCSLPAPSCTGQNGPWYNPVQPRLLNFKISSSQPCSHRAAVLSIIRHPCHQHRASNSCPIPSSHVLDSRQCRQHITNSLIESCHLYIVRA
jgi:hypothetical protein